MIPGEIGCKKALAQESRKENEETDSLTSLPLKFRTADSI